MGSVNKKIVDRKRRIAVDTDGRRLMLTTADTSDSTGVQAILDAIRKRWPWVKHLFADGAYDRTKLMDKTSYLDFVIKIVRRIGGAEGFHAATPVGGRTHLRMDDALETSRVRLRATDQCLRIHDPHRTQIAPHQANCPFVKAFSKSTLIQQAKNCYCN